MSGLDVAAATVAFAEVTLEVTKLLKEVRSNIRDGDKFEKRLKDVDQLHALAECIKARDSDLGNYNIEYELQRCNEICQDLVTILASLRVTTADAGGQSQPQPQPKGLWHQGSAQSHKIWKAFKAVNKEDEINDKFEELERQKSSICVKLGLNQSQLAEKHSTQLQTLHEKVDAIRNNTINFGPDEERCLQALFAVDPGTVRETIITSRGRKVQDTCEWVTQTTEFETWLSSSATSKNLLWIHGGPGKGKTFISIHLSQYLEKLQQNDADATVSSNDAVIFFFCNGTISDQRSGVSILRGLLYQLVQFDKSLLTYLLPDWKVQQDRLFQEDSFETLWRIFVAIVTAPAPGQRKVFCVLDGLDECEEVSLKVLTAKLRYIGQEGYHRFRIVVLSRSHPELISSTLRSHLQIDVDQPETGVAGDVEKYIALRVEELASAKGLAPGDKVYRHIQQTFIDKSDHTFLWISLMYEDLKPKNLTEIEKCLDSLPKGLSEIYSRILEHVQDRDQGPISHLLTCVALALKPLTVSDLCILLNVKETKHLTAEQVCHDLVQSCGHFLRTVDMKAFDLDYSPTNGDGTDEDPTDDDDTDEDAGVGCEVIQTVQLVHQSAKDFLVESAPETFRLNEAQGNLRIASLLIDHLRSHWLKVRYSGRYSIARTPIEAFWKHIDAWPTYAKRSGTQGKQLSQLNPWFFADQCKIRDEWLGQHDDLLERHTRDDKQKHVVQEVPVMYMLAVLGLSDLMDQLFDLPRRCKFLSRRCRSRLVNQVVKCSCGCQKSALVAAYENRHYITAGKLLEHGADLSCPLLWDMTWIGSVMTSLHGMAVYAPHEVMKQALETKTGLKVLKRDLKAYKQDSKHYSLLHAAVSSWNHTEATCELLAERYGYAEAARAHNDESIVHLALEMGGLELSRILIENCGLPIGNHKTVVHGLGSITYREEVRQFMEYLRDKHKFSVNTQDESGQTLLHHYFSPGVFFRVLHHSGNWLRLNETLQWLLDSGADCRIRNNSNELPHMAVRLCGLPRHSVSVESYMRSLAKLLGHDSVSINDTDANKATLLHHFVDIWPWLQYGFSKERGLLWCWSPALSDLGFALLDLGCEVGKRDDKGHTPLDKCQKQLEHARKMEKIENDPDLVRLCKFWRENQEGWETVLKNYQTVPVDNSRAETLIDDLDWPSMRKASEAAEAIWENVRLLFLNSMPTGRDRGIYPRSESSESSKSDVTGRSDGESRSPTQEPTQERTQEPTQDIEESVASEQ